MTFLYYCYIPQASYNRFSVPGGFFCLVLFCFFVNPFRLSIQTLMLSVKKEMYMSSLPICVSFISFCCLFCINQYFQYDVEKGWQEKGPLCLVQSCWESSKLFSIRHDVSCTVFVSGVYKLRKIPLNSLLTERFNHERVLDFAKCFFCMN